MFTAQEIATLIIIYGDNAGDYIAKAPEIARANFDALAALPEGFTSIIDALPETEAPVLAIRRSGYVSCQYEVVTARYQPTYRPHAPWRDISGDNITDSGEPILGWQWANATLRPSA